MFFPTVPHEAAHISAYEKKANDATKEVLKGANDILQEYNNLPILARNNPQIRQNYLTIANKYYLRNKNIFDKWQEERKISHGAHWKEPWYSDYVNFHETLMKSQYAKYNYFDKSPLSYEDSWEN